MNILIYIYIVPAALIAIVFHELAHGYISYRLGDPTPKEAGRLTLNPLKHLDPIGTAMLIIFRFGWAKPVMVNPDYYKNKKLGMVLVALAGPITNLIIAFISLLILGIIVKTNDLTLAALLDTSYGQFINLLAIINIGLGLFNLIPIPPLDGSKVLGAILPEDLYFSYMKYESFGFIILIALLFFDILDLQKALYFVYNGLFSIVEKITFYL